MIMVFCICLSLLYYQFKPTKNMMVFYGVIIAQKIYFEKLKSAGLK